MVPLEKPTHAVCFTCAPSSVIARSGWPCCTTVLHRVAQQCCNALLCPRPHLPFVPAQNAQRGVPCFAVPCFAVHGRDRDSALHWEDGPPVLTGEPSPGADVEGESSVPAQMWQG